MGGIIYKRNEFIIIISHDGYVVYNRNKKFEKGHTHLNSLEACKMAINCVLNRKIPRHFSLYFLGSLERLAKDSKYIEKVKELIEVKKQRGKKEYYYNPQKGRKKK